MEKKISEIKEEFSAADVADLPALFKQYQDDLRSGVQAVIKKYFNIHDKWLKELFRLEQMKKYENGYQQYTCICGIDEAGRGPLAGPVSAGAVVLPKNCQIPYLNDSKKLSPAKREELYEVITHEAVAWGVGLIGPDVIDEINILQATYRAMKLAIGQLGVEPDLLLNDAVTIPGLTVKQVPIVKGDAKSVSIAAASILAKVTRDRLMEQYDRIYPEYGFASHKGYGSAAHIEAIKKYGPCPIHRRTFIKNFIQTDGDNE